ncbi:MAG: hypothetical protein QOI15_2061 [Pseudonocardiales bacterium]|nr:hypothetical protein [Pseudonocardiales bacterium]
MPDSVRDVLELALTEDGVVRTYLMARTPDGCELVPGPRGRFASAGWAFFEDVQDLLDVDFFLDQFDPVLGGVRAIARTGTNITNLEITPDVSWLRMLGETGRGAAIPTGEFRDQLRCLRRFLSPAR